MDTGSHPPFRVAAMRTTPYPNRLLEMSVTLPETQLRVLNLIVRSTLGWSAGPGGERRSSVTLTVGQLTRRVGRTSPASVAEALAALINRGVIEIYVTDGAGLALSDLARNRHRRLTVCLARQWVEEA